ncbi:rRNA pseudouridine synthase [Sporolactobacillus shoreicorticis]|uniref:Pseudouridine synthase n=1 Tax=Sporolactobacillus shoreicorticis TaxID=1923877 RepID=A0ABW5RZA2_9BACL|nr:pseudouridine synthase [Sporolactobacillus shoreicorticis]MCO7126750.1 rRNA pseudouridine synthase [Sporolactobacillus shoreicorticis]
MERLQKIIARAGVASRRKAEQLIVEGKVQVNGVTITELGTKVSVNDKVTVNGIPLDKERLVYYLFYKPTGVITTVKDDRNRTTVVDFFKQVPERIFPVGRLDYDTSGALLMTNDGELANKLMHPSFEFDKTYIAHVNPIPTKDQLRQLASGIRLEDGMTAKARVQLLVSDKENGTASVQLTIHEGRNRQIRRMFSALHLHVRKLKRDRYGFLGLTGLHPGESRALKPHEVKTLMHITRHS